MPDRHYRELGQTFDAKRPFLKSLPARQQEDLRRPTGLFGVEGSVLRNYNEVEHYGLRAITERRLHTMTYFACVRSTSLVAHYRHTNLF